jgi:hypothetical protein
MENKETLEEAAERLFGKHFNAMHYDDIDNKHIINYALELAQWQEERMYNEEEVADYVRPKEDTPVEIVYVKETDWYPAKQINFFDLGNSLEIVYKEECEKIHLERVFKIVYSCIDGKWNKSEPIYASRINGKYNFINK